MHRSATRMWLSICSSLEEAQTSAGTLRRKSVTSSGRSSTSRIITWHSGLFSRTPSAMSRKSVVLPVRGGATMRPRVPLPIGQNRSTARVVIRPSLVSSFRCCSGEIVVSVVNSNLPRRSSSGMPSTVSMKRIFGLGKRPSAGKAVPPIRLPSRSLKRRISSLGTKVSSGLRLPPRFRSINWPLPPRWRSMSSTPSTRIRFSSATALLAAGSGLLATASGSVAVSRGVAPSFVSASAEGVLISIQSVIKMWLALDAQNSRWDKASDSLSSPPSATPNPARSCD